MRHILSIILVLALYLPMNTASAADAPSCADKRACQCYVNNRWVAWPCGKAAERSCRLWSR